MARNQKKRLLRASSHATYHFMREICRANKMWRGCGRIWAIGTFPVRSKWAALGRVLEATRAVILLRCRSAEALGKQMHSDVV